MLIEPLKSFSRYRAIWKLPLVAILLINGCVHDVPTNPLGSQEGYKAFVPARTAVLPCLSWPSSSGFANLKLSNASVETQVEFCQQFNTFVINGFKDQPYMRGFSPKAINRMLTANPKLTHPKEAINSHWNHNKSDCATCEDPQTFYSQSIADRMNWIVWLKTFSTATRHSDSVLIPFVVSMSESQGIDRGTQFIERSALVYLFLIDSRSGSLIWAGSSQASAIERVALQNSSSLETSLSPPSWDIVAQRAFSKTMWREYPGRQVF